MTDRAYHAESKHRPFGDTVDHASKDHNPPHGMCLGHFTLKDLRNVNKMCGLEQKGPTPTPGEPPQNGKTFKNGQNENEW